VKNLNVLFLWHMHQPSYRVDNESFFLPWTRLHGTKDYVGMAKVVAKSSAFQMTFNFTPVLWEQLLAYSHGDLDKELELSLKPAVSLTIEERQYLLRKMFSGNPISLINPFPRYHRLMGRNRYASRMTERDLTDLVVWRILAWIYPEIRESDPFIRSLVEKQTGFQQSDVQQLVDWTRDSLASIPGLYKELSSKGQISLSTTPYYHPILPLLLNSETARDCHPGVALPPGFSFPDDAKWHIEEAINLHQSLFDELPAGMWPAEGSVSHDAATLFAQNNIKWIASDEVILFRSLGEDLHRNQHGTINRPDLLYQPWLYRTDGGDITMFFRDHYLSDLIGFDYQSIPVEQGVADFIRRLKFIAEMTRDAAIEPCVSVILDGENAWEHYHNGGFDFLHALFSAIENEDGLIMKTIPDYLDGVTGNLPEIKQLSPGSWINGNFDIWIGDKEENLAWECIRDLHDATGETLAKHDSDAPDSCHKALNFLRKSQASDTFWWFGDDHFTSEKGDFDTLFREVLIKGYETAGLLPPTMLYRPLIQSGPASSSISYPKNLISPIIDGEVKSYFDWYGAGVIQGTRRFSAMHSSSETDFFNRMLFGFDLETLYLRLDPNDAFFKTIETGGILDIDVTFNEPEHAVNFSIGLDFQNWTSDGAVKTLVTNSSENIFSGNVRFNQIFEAEIKFKDIGVRPDERLSFYLEVYLDSKLSCRLPDHGAIEFFCPTEDYNSLMWRV